MLLPPQPDLLHLVRLVLSGQVGAEVVDADEVAAGRTGPVHPQRVDLVLVPASVIETEVLTWDVYSSMARSGLPNSGLGSDEVKAGTAADQRIRGKALPSNVTSEGRRQISSQG